MKVVCCFFPSEAESPRGVDGGAFSFRSCNVGGESDSHYDSNMGLAGAVAEAKEDGKPSERCQGLQSQPCKLNLFSNDSKQNYMLKVRLPIKLSTNMISFEDRSGGEKETKLNKCRSALLDLPSMITIDWKGILRVRIYGTKHHFGRGQ
ncbi:uncharacterized protein LOC130722407 isoform X2 [Lotus japonicus]|uniref:uncharacterized protein LOC130722407 isoform X2 n=1 Tax=Lotus japonicus TaxID=34305 RepID=UPI00258A2623|nr:uncharacterized protein LOC130722407 isoform X2 [Lotus japonicus]